MKEYAKGREGGKEGDPGREGGREGGRYQTMRYLGEFVCTQVPTWSINSIQ